MIRIITGMPRVGKTALNTYFLKQEQHLQGRSILEYARSATAKMNAVRTSPLALPDRVPIYANYVAKFICGYKKVYEPYWLNPYYLGISNGVMPTISLYPGSKLHVTEGQKYWNSRESSSMPIWVSAFFETHGHYGLDITIDVQRGKLIDLNIRELCPQFIEVQRMENVKDELGRIIQSTWHCREFNNMQSYEDYVEHGGNGYSKTTYTHRGDIFKCFDSHSCEEDFEPKEGIEFNEITFIKDSKPVKVDIERYYSKSIPEEWRKKAA